MKKLNVLIIFIFFFIVRLSAQTTESWIDTKKPLLFEKLYIHVDREFYSPGDMIWLKVYHVNGYTHQLNSNYRNIVVQLVSEEGKIVRDILLFSMKGQANGELTTDALPEGVYTIRATDKYLENYGEDAMFHKKVWISKSQKAKEPIDKQKADSSKIAVDFLPEGGNMVLNVPNNIAFKAINQKGRGIDISGKIVNDLGETIIPFSTSYLGMGKIQLTPLDGRSYYAVIDHHPDLKIGLPAAISMGLSLKYIQSNDSLKFEISTNYKQKYNQPFTFIASHKGMILHVTEIGLDGFSQVIRLKKELFPTGISKITLQDTALHVIAERLIFVDNDKNVSLKLGLNQKEFKPREEVKIEVDLGLNPGDSIKSTLSVSVANRSLFSTGENTQNIKSYLLLDSELKGALESPADCFVDDRQHTSAEKLDLVMLVHGWRSYLWDDVEKTPLPSLDDWNDAGLTISGYVKKLLWNAPSSEAEVSLDYVFKKFKVGQTTADKNGRFLFKNIFLLDNLKIMLNAQTRGGNRNAEIILDPVPKKDSVIVLNNPCFDIDLNSAFMHENFSKRKKELDFIPESGSILLESIDIVKKKDNAMMRSFGAYPWADKTLTITRNDYTFYTLQDYLLAKLPGFMEMGDEISFKNRPVDFMVDGLDSYYSYREIRTIKMNEIQTIDIVDPGFRRGFSMGELGVVNENGLIAIYKKAEPDILQSDIYVKGRIMPKLKGYTLPGKFYSPEYTLENRQSPVPDVRPTLYWNPDIQTENGHATIQFFTSDVHADYVVYLEGISKKGKICYGTTTFSVDKK